jgi:hypothetical protein
MQKRQPLNRRLTAWLLMAALVFSVASSGASWQCLDGHPCPPGCKMTSNPTAASTRSCCQTAKKNCPMCAGASAAPHSGVRMGCTSPICVVRFKDKPDALKQAVVRFHVELEAVVLPPTPVLIAPEMTASVYAGSPRAPPRHIVTRSCSPRAPPILL